MKSLAVSMLVFCLPVGLFAQQSVPQVKIPCPDGFFQAAAGSVFRGGRRRGGQFKGTRLRLLSWRYDRAEAYGAAASAVARV